MKKVMILLVLCLLVAGMTGCMSYVTAGDRAVIHANYLNAVDTSVKVQTDPACPQYARDWWRDEAKTWTALDAWSRGVKFPTTAPAGK